MVSQLSLKQLIEGSNPSARAVAVVYWFRNLAVNQVYVGSIPIGHPMNVANSPVAQRRRHLVYTQSIDGSSPSRTTHGNGANPLGAGPACKTCSLEFESH